MRVDETLPAFEQRLHESGRSKLSLSGSLDHRGLQAPPTLLTHIGCRSAQPSYPNMPITVVNKGVQANRNQMLERFSK